MATHAYPTIIHLRQKYDQVPIESLWDQIISPLIAIYQLAK